MRAIVLDRPGPPESFRYEDRPTPPAGPGEVLLRVEAFGLNRSELHTRLGLAGDAVTFPRVLGIEAAGVVEQAPDHPDWVGRKAVTMMGGMGRRFDGGYADYTRVPEQQVVLVDTALDWARLGALPEIVQTASGALATLGVEAGHTLLVRGGTSSVGTMAALLAKRRGARVLSTTRSAGRADMLRSLGVDEVVVDDGAIAGAVHALVPGGVDAALELVGAPTLQDTLRSCRRGGVTCFAGMLSNQWIIEAFYPLGFIPIGVHLTVYAGDASDLDAAVLEDVAGALHRGEVSWPIVPYAFDQIAEAHRDMEENRVTGKQVVVVRS